MGTEQRILTEEPLKRVDTVQTNLVTERHSSALLHLTGQLATGPSGCCGAPGGTSRPAPECRADRAAEAPNPLGDTFVFSVNQMQKSNQNRLSRNGNFLNGKDGFLQLRLTDTRNQIGTYYPQGQESSKEAMKEPQEGSII